MERSFVTYPNISESGTLASMTFAVPLSNMRSIFPRFEERSPVTSPKNCSGVTTSTFIIGSKRIAWARLAASCKAMDPAILKAASDFAFKFKSFAALLRFNPKPDMPILPVPAGLLDVFAFSFGGFFDGFFVSDLRAPDIRPDFKFALHPLHDNFQMELAHSGNNCLHCFFVALDSESWIFIRKALQS